MHLLGAAECVVTACVFVNIYIYIFFKCCTAGPAVAVCPGVVGAFCGDDNPTNGLQSNCVEGCTRVPLFVLQ
jgi:hypothetical protein